MHLSGYSKRGVQMQNLWRNWNFKRNFSISKPIFRWIYGMLTSRISLLINLSINQKQKCLKSFWVLHHEILIWKSNIHEKQCIKLHSWIFLDWYKSWKVETYDTIYNIFGKFYLYGNQYLQFYKGTQFRDF